MRDHYDVIVIGSGYGAGVAASRLARAGRRVCVLERGREFRPGEYPDSMGEAAAEMQVHSKRGHVGPATGLYDFHVHEDISVLVGCGLGGTSLINANVALRAVDGVWTDSHWPAELRGRGNVELEAHYVRAETMLGSTPYPDDGPRLAKLEANRVSAAALGLRIYNPPLNIHFEAGVNPAGVSQSACNNCGDCVSGCNAGAKNTTLMNYLPDAVAHGAEIYCECSVVHVAREQGPEGPWTVFYEVVGRGREAFGAESLMVTADIVVLGAGTLGSTEILLRSKQRGLALSNQLGQRFSGNGDVLGFAYNCDRIIDGVGFGTRVPGSQDPVGPCITTIIDNRDTADWRAGWVVEEGTIPGAFAPILPKVFAAASSAEGVDTDHGVVDWLRERGREVVSVIAGAYRGAMRNTQTYLVMAHDGSAGRLSLDHDRLALTWPGVGEEPIFTEVNGVLEQLTAALGGTFDRNPIWSKMFNNALISVHPLGGCAMGDDASVGVVDHKSRVFAGSSGTEVHTGLYVADGSVVPLSIGVNPLLTISALAERSMALLAADHGWTIDYAPVSPGGAVTRPDTPTVGVRFSERMHGFFSTAATAREAGAFQVAYDQGEQAASAMDFVLTIETDDVEALVDRPDHLAEMIGTVECGALSAEPLTVHQGRFGLFVDDPSAVETKRMLYSANLVADDGRRFHFEGFKLVHTASVLSGWAQTTTLYVTVREGWVEPGRDADPSQAIVGQGILHIRPVDFAKQLTTMRAVDAPSPAAGLRALARFGAYFGGVLWETYGGLTVPERYFDPKAAPRKKRALRVDAPPELHWFKTRDDVDLRLTRYRGGAKGPVMLVHGAGVSSEIFSTDLIDTNLVEYLYAHGYDVWLFDFRVSIALPASQSPSTGDQIAHIDHPAAVDYIREATGAASIQAVVHCYGANTFVMALLAGMTGVRSVVCSQVATDLIAPLGTRVKSALHMPSVLELFGVESLTAAVDASSDWKAKLFDELLRLYPTHPDDRSHNPVDKRIHFLYGQLYEHQQLDQRTFDNLHELFGVANIAAFEHLAAMVRAEHVVSAEEQDIYMPHLERLALPIRFIHGAENQCYLPKSTELTLDRLSARNGPELYDRRLIPEYGHIDCIFGKHAVDDVYPLVLEHLDKSAQP